MSDQDEDDEDDWIVNEFEDEEVAGGAGGDVEEDGDRARAGREEKARRRERRKAITEGLPGIDPAALDEANDIFGDVDDMLAIYEARRAEHKEAGDGGEAGLDGTGAGGEEEDDDDGYAGLGEDELSDEEAAEELRVCREERRKAAAERRLRARLEPSAAEKHFMLPEDERIRETDAPERFQVHLVRDGVGVGSGGVDIASMVHSFTEESVDACAEWIWERLIGHKGSVSRVYRTMLEEGVREVEGPPPAWMQELLNSSVWPAGRLKGGVQNTQSHRALYLGRDSAQEISGWRECEGAQNELKRSIAYLVKAMYMDHEDIPFIAMYRKEKLGELLCMRRGDEPTDRRNAFDDDDDDTHDDGATRGQNGEKRRGRQFRLLSEGSREGLSARDRVIRRWDLLYVVHHLAWQYQVLHRRKESRLSMYQQTLEQVAAKAAAGDEDAANRCALIEACISRVHMADSLETLDDIDAKFRTGSSATSSGGTTALPEEDGVASLDLEDDDAQQQDGTGGHAAPSQKRRPRRTSPYVTAVNAGLGEAAAALGISSAQLSENLESGFKMHETVDPSLFPVDHMASFVDENVPPRKNVETVHRSMLTVAATDISTEPYIRQYVREFYWSNCVVSSRLTPLGEKTLGPFHQLGITKRIKNKPLSSFGMSDTFLRLLKAETEGFLTLKFDAMIDTRRMQLGPALDDDGTSALIGALVNILQDFYLSSDIQSSTAEHWNELRVQALQQAMMLLIPSMEKEARSRLAKEARDNVVDSISNRLWSYLSRAPPKFIDTEEEQEVMDKRIMAVCYGSGGQLPTTVAMLDAAGNLIDYLHCPQFSGYIPKTRALPGTVYSILEDPKKASDAKRLMDMIEQHLPHAILVGISHGQSLTLVENVKQIIDHILFYNARLVTSLETGGFDLLQSDETMAVAWGASQAAKDELPNASVMVRRAVGLARTALEPVAVLAALCGRSREVLSLNLHSMQSMIPQDERMSAAERAVCTAAAHIGIDINAATLSAWQLHLVQFLPGLGPRKAAALLRAIARGGGHVESRQQLVQQALRTSKNVYKNVAPYLRVRASSKATTNLELNLLDDTRVHPESYQLAVAMAQSATGAEDEEVALENAFASPEDVAQLELDVYDARLQEKDRENLEEGGGAGGADGAGLYGSRLSTLIDIQMEFSMPYSDLRKPYLRLTPRNVFFLASGEWQETFLSGRKVECRVRFVREKEVYCIVPELNDMEGVIASDAVSSNNYDVDCREYFKNGDTVIAAILGMDHETNAVKLTTSSKELNRDRYYEEVLHAEREGR